MSHNNILLESGTNELEIVEFYIDEPGYRGHYGVNVAKVIEIIRTQPVTAMPQMRHPAVMGAFPHRDGKVVPLVDLGKYLLKGAIDQNNAKIIVTEFNSIVTAFLVSGVNRIHRLNWNEVEEPGGFLQNMSENTVTGVIRLEGRVIFMLDLENVVASIDPALAIKLAEFAPKTALDSEYVILHADDSGSIRALVKRMLEKSERFKVVQATSGQEAWDILVRYKQRALDEGIPLRDVVQAVVTDVEMPRMDGLTLCRLIKEDPILKELPVALFSSLITEKLEHKGLSVGADAQFAKPDLQALSTKVIDLITEKQASYR